MSDMGGFGVQGSGFSSRRNAGVGFGVVAGLPTVPLFPTDGLSDPQQSETFGRILYGVGRPAHNAIRAQRDSRTTRFVYNALPAVHKLRGVQ